jgi:hypothetical protein
MAYIPPGSKDYRAMNPIVWGKAVGNLVIGAVFVVVTAAALVLGGLNSKPGEASFVQKTWESARQAFSNAAHLR